MPEKNEKLHEKRETKNDGKAPEDETRRAFLKAAGASAGALIFGALSFETFITPETRYTPVIDGYPVAVLVDSSGKPIKSTRIPPATTASSSYPIMAFNYPLQDEPNILVKLDGVQIPNGAGPESNITAFSGICQHLGCVVPLLDYHPHNSIPFEAKLIGYNETNWPPYGLMFCKCHGSQYDPTRGPHNLYNSGPAPSPANHSLPQVLLYVDADDNVYATGINPVNAVIRTHLEEPGGEEYGSKVMEENLSGGTLLPLYKGPPLPSLPQEIKPADKPLYMTIVASSSNGPWPGSF
ncbi:MAG: ubiquinol-cytochrome c reductase iron-sulfur subunit [Candidatus Thermoplasmatota archaeon]|nr:ubiquinol-cytochrome c reductase iron-sulfur subunit [Candidatus Thermoplasmatota archaeon]